MRNLSYRRARFMTILGYIAAGLFLIVVAIAVLSIKSSGARRELLKTYSRVDSITRSPIQFSCKFGKNRQRYDFVARRANGSVVRGYMCYSGPLTLYGSAIHEVSG